MDDQREVPLDEEQDSINDEFAPVISPDPRVPPERDPLAGQPIHELEPTGPHDLDREATESVEADETGGGIPGSEYVAEERIRTTDTSGQDEPTDEP